MKLTGIVKLLPTPEQRQNLYQTLECANAACNWISQQAWEAKVFGRNSDGRFYSGKHLLNVRHRHGCFARNSRKKARNLLNKN